MGPKKLIVQFDSYQETTRMIKQIKVLNDLSIRIKIWFNIPNFQIRFNVYLFSHLNQFEIMCW